MDPVPRCPDDHELARFVQQLLPDPQSERIRDHLDVCDPCRLGIVAGLSACDTGEPSPLATDVGRGLRLGPFELVRRLGAGGMGVVYEAIDHRLGRAVAVKLVRGDHDASLLEEARAMARVRHPAVLTVYEAGILDGSVYLATELIPGTTLRTHCAGKGAREILALYLRAAEGLAAAHAHRLVHRDFKPDNVLVEVTADGPRVLVADFGLATARERDTSFAHGSAPAGTPAYMAPEQIDGTCIDERADVFAFCVALWEALAGTRPFAGSTLAELRAAMQRPLRAPRGVPAVLVRGLAIDPAARPTLAEILRVLRPRRRRAYGVALAIAAATAVFALWPSRPRAPDLAAACNAVRTPSQATAGWRAATLPPWVEQRVARVLEEREREVTTLQRQVCAQPDDAARTAWIRCRGDHAIEEAELARALATPWPSYDELDQALALPWPSTCASRAARLDAVLPPADAAKTALARARFATYRGTAWTVAPGGPLEAERLLDEATYTRDLPTADRLALLDRAVERAEREGHVTTAARAWLALAAARGDAAADLAAIEHAYAQASWAIDRVGDPPMLRARWHEVSAAFAWRRTDLAAAQHHAKRAAELAGDDPYRRAVALHALAAAAGARADFKAQRALLEELAPSFADARGADAVRFRMAYAECLYHLGELALGRAQAELGIALARETAGELDPTTAQALLVLGFIQLDEGKPAECITTIARALSILDATVGRDHLLAGAALNLRSAAHAAHEDYRAALADSEAAAALFEAKLGPRAEEVIFARSQSGEQARMLGDHARARTLLAQVLDDARATYGTDDPRTADAERSLATIYVDDGRKAEARALLQHAIGVQEAAGTDPQYLAQAQAALAKLTGDRALALRAAAAWRDDPAWKSEHADLARWLRSRR